MPDRIPMVGSLSNLSRPRGYLNKIIDPKAVLWSRWGSGEWGTGGYAIESDQDLLALGVKGDVHLIPGPALLVSGVFYDYFGSTPNPWVRHAMFHLDQNYMPTFFYILEYTTDYYLHDTSYIIDMEYQIAGPGDKVYYGSSKQVVFTHCRWDKSGYEYDLTRSGFVARQPRFQSLTTGDSWHVIDNEVENYDIRTILPITSNTVGFLDNNGAFIVWSVYIGKDIRQEACLGTIETGGTFTGSAYVQSFGETVFLYEGDNVYRINGVPDNMSVDVWDSGWDFGEGVHVGRGGIMDSSGIIYKWGCDSDGYVYQAAIDGWGDFENEDTLLYSEKSESPKGLTADSTLGNPIGPIGGRVILSDGQGYLVWSPIGEGTVDQIQIAGHMPYLYYVGCGVYKVDPPCNKAHFTGYRHVFLGEHFYAAAEYDIEGTNAPDGDKCKGIHGVIYENHIQCNLWGYQGSNPIYIPR